MKPDFTRQLLLWNKRDNKRPMPWKGEKNPYKIWLSEIILQQTRVEQGRAYYEKFVKAFPTVQQLARAQEKKVFKMWEGLGYYTRCKNLLASARKIATELHGKFPSTYEEIKKLKGVGPYTAAAISSFAFNEPQAVVDGNVQRILSRYFGISTPVDSTDGKKLYQSLAQALLDSKQPGKYNQAIMDFGAVICKPRNPLCTTCIQHKECEAFKYNLVNQLPVKEKARPRKNRWLCYFIIELQDKVYIRKRTGKDIWENLHEFVLFEMTEKPNGPFPFAPVLKKLLGKQPYRLKMVSKEFRQQLTHQSVYGQFITIRINKPAPLLKDYMLVEKKHLSRYAFPRVINNFLKEPAQTSLF